MGLERMGARRRRELRLAIGAAPGGHLALLTLPGPASGPGP